MESSPFRLYCNSAIGTEWLYFTRQKAFNTQGLSRSQVINSHRPNSSLCLFNKTHKGVLRRGSRKSSFRHYLSLLIWRVSLSYGWGPLMTARNTNIRYQYKTPIHSPSNWPLLGISLLWADGWYIKQRLWEWKEKKQEAKIHSTQREATIILLYNDPMKSVNYTLFI